MSADHSEIAPTANEKMSLIRGYFAEISEDKFTGVRSSEFKAPFSWSYINKLAVPPESRAFEAIRDTGFLTLEHASLIMGLSYRHVDDVDGIFLVFIFEGMNYNWPGMEKLTLFFILDNNKRITLDERSEHSFDSEVISSINSVKRREMVQLKIPLSDFMELMNASKVEYRISFGLINLEGEIGRDKILSLRGFYNNTFDEDFDVDNLYEAVEVRKKVSSESSGGCYIATAVYGGYEHPQVIKLRIFRDKVLARSAVGRLIIKTYYQISPPLARKLERGHRMNNFVRAFLDGFIKALERKHD